MISQILKNFMSILILSQVAFTIAVIIYKVLGRENENVFVDRMLSTMMICFFVINISNGFYVPEIVLEDISEQKCPGYFKSNIEVSVKSSRLICEYPQKDIEIYILNSEEIEKYNYGTYAGLIGMICVGVLFFFLFIYNTDNRRGG